MLLAENLRRLRLDRGLTQEALAGLLAVTPQTVSKWERGAGLPDISLLPSLTAALRASADELLGLTGDRRQAQQEAAWEAMRLMEQAMERAPSQPDMAEAVAYLRRKLRDMPDAWLLWYDLAIALSQTGCREADGLEAAAIYRRVAAQCPERPLARMAALQPPLVLSMLGREAEAREAADELPRLWECYEVIAPQLLRGEERRTFLAEAAYSAVQSLSNLAIDATGELAADTPVSEKLAWCDLALRVCQAYGSRAASGGLGCPHALRGAEYSMALGDPAGALSRLEQAVACYLAAEPWYRQLAADSLQEKLWAAADAPDGVFYPLRTEPRLLALREKVGAGTRD